MWAFLNLKRLRVFSGKTFAENDFQNGDLVFNIYDIFKLLLEKRGLPFPLQIFQSIRIHSN